jgi:hypothetical protein
LNRSRAKRPDGAPALPARSIIHLNVPLVSLWIAALGLGPARYSTHSLPRTKPTLVLASDGNLRVVRLLLGHTGLESTVGYLGIEVDDALTIAGQIDL